MAGTLTISTLSDGTNSTSSTNCIQGSAKAWVNFNGSVTPTINASYNVSSITYTASFLWTINFTNAFSDANYSAVTGVSNAQGNRAATLVQNSSTAQTTTTCQFYYYDNASGQSVFPRGNIAFFR